MLYIFYGSHYQSVYQKALLESKKTSKKTIIINESVIDYKKDDIHNFLYYFLLESSEQIHLVIERPEQINVFTMQSFLDLFENIPVNHTIILVTTNIDLLPKTIISRSLLFFDEDVDSAKYESFLTMFSAVENDELWNMNNVLDVHGITEKNTPEVTLELIKKIPEKEEELLSLLKKYTFFIQNAHYNYWKVAYAIINS